MNRTERAAKRGLNQPAHRIHALGTRIGHRRTVGVAAFAATLVLVATLVNPVAPAQAVSYPSWEDLQNAKASTSAAAASVTEIQGLIAGLQTEVQRTQAEADARGEELLLAQEQFDDATRRAEDLQAQADASRLVADDATRQAGQLAAQLYRTGGTDLGVNLFLDGEAAAAGADQGGSDGQGTSAPGGADALLRKLGSMSKLVERSTGVYEQAQTAQNNAQALGDQATIAQAEREALRIVAEEALAVAQSAAEAAGAALAESEAKGQELQAQLAFLQDAEAVTAAGYEAGVIERARIAAEAARAAESARVARAAADRPAAAAAAGASLGGGYTSSSGWAVPASGRITGGYGPRSVICGGGSCSGGYHYGTDLGTGCNAPIYAASAGTVTYAGRLGTYGNFVKIDHGNGVSTGYAHIVDGGVYVRAGQPVGVGDNIASSGSTGVSTACHLHFEVWLNGVRSNAAPFMAAQGASLG
ncbi:MAG: M23 family metallopeptidase [Cryobacterium sp.]